MLARKGRSTPHGEPKSKQPLLLSTTRLPSLFAGREKKTTSPLTALLRLTGWISGVIVIGWFASSILRSERSPSAVNYLSQDGEAYEIVGADTLPEGPSPVVVTDKRGRSRWTVSIPPALDFPLRPVEYANICVQTEEVARHVAEIKMHESGDHHHSKHYGYYRVDPNFMDVAEAEEHGMLPGSSSNSKKNIWDKMMGDEGKDMMGEDSVTMQGDGKGKFCEKSLTYVMETEDAGMGNTLMGLWMSYGLAQKEGRAFFLEDKHWAYGDYTTFFKPPPTPSCLPPPRTQMLPFPHHARHLLVSSATKGWTFGHNFHEQFEDARKMEVYRLRTFFNFMRTGYEALFDLAGEDGTYLVHRLDDLNSTIRERGGLEIGVHVRHGDRHPMEYKYQKSYLPLENYVSAARDMLVDTYGNTTITDQVSDFPPDIASKMLLASDDPDVYASPAFNSALRAQSQISLASKAALDATSAAAGQPPSPIDQNVGWEGGFFKDVFWSLGQASMIPAPTNSPRPSKRRKAPETLTARSLNHRVASPEAMKLREMIGRAYLLDLAVLGHADRVICGVSSTSCRLLAVMMGWDKAIVQGAWKNIDGDWDWKGISW